MTAKRRTGRRGMARPRFTGCRMAADVGRSFWAIAPPLGGLVQQANPHPVTTATITYTDGQTLPGLVWFARSDAQRLVTAPPWDG